MSQVLSSPRSPHLRSWSEVTEEQARLQKMIEAAAPEAGSKPRLAQCLTITAPVVSWIAAVLHWSLPMVRFLCYNGYNIWVRLPHNVARGCVGTALCLFGGTFPTLIAATEAALNSGWPGTKAALIDLWSESERMIEVMEEDDQKDEDGDGIRDVQQISGRQLVARKLHVFFENADAQKVNRALGGLYTSATAVCAVLRVQFAQTIALSVSISKMLHKPVTFCVSPTIHYLSTLYDGKPHYQQWVPLVIDYSCKAAGMVVAWRLQQYLSAFHSATRGGLMVSQALLQIAASKLRWNFDPDVSNIDDAIGWVIAAGGMYYQIRMGFSLPFPFNLLLLPFRILETQLQYHVTYGVEAPASTA